MIKNCTRCNEIKNISEFHKRGGNGVRSICKKCISIEHKEKFAISGKWHPNLKRRRQLAKETLYRCLDHYGHKCAFCGSTEKLGMDHIGGNNGNSPRGGVTLWRWLIRNGFPSEFRTLCNRCNILDGVLRKHPHLGLSGIDTLKFMARRKSKGKDEKGGLNHPKTG